MYKYFANIKYLNNIDIVDDIHNDIYFNDNQLNIKYIGEINEKKKTFEKFFNVCILNITSNIKDVPLLKEIGDYWSHNDIIYNCH